jgi:hypothetical protein
MTWTDERPSAFSHAEREPPPAAKPLTSTTRYLSGAAYVDQRYAEIVVDELVGQSHRAVAPTLDYDLVTIIRHCFRAQRLWLRQNGLLTVVLVAGLVVFTSATVTLFTVCLIAHLIRPGRTRSGTRGANGRAIAGVVLVLVAVGCLAGLGRTLVALLVPGGWFPSSGLHSSEPSPGVTGGGTVARFVLGLLALTIGLIVVLTYHRYRMIEIIAGDLARGRPPTVGRPEAREVEHRLGFVAAAQAGNILLHAGFEPFVGAGERVNTWAVATELRADRGDEPGSGPAPRVDIDADDLVRHLRVRLAEMRSRELPEPARILGLQLRDQIVSSGTRWHDYPLIDDRTRLPYSLAEPPTVEAIIRSPQTSARHFLRVSVGAPDRAAVGADGRTIMPAEHQSVISSTFVHVAVEGGLLYVELVAAVLGPIRQAYLDIDRYSGSGERLGTAIGEAFRRLLGDVAVAPYQLVRGLFRRFTLVSAMYRADREASREPVYDFGARLDVRQLASRPTFANYLQGLDAEKYTRIIDRRVTEAIDEYLVAHGVDSSDFVAKATFHQNMTVNGDNYGPIATGHGATATQTGTTIKGSTA